MSHREPAVVRRYEPRDEAEWLRMRKQLWPDADLLDALAWRSRADAAIIVAERPEAGLAGFAEVGTRAYADGCETTPLAFLEGWYVDPDVRTRGIGASLVRAVELWAIHQGFQELASDSLLDDYTAHTAHLAVGFEEVERSIKYRRKLADPDL